MIINSCTVSDTRWMKSGVENVQLSIINFLFDRVELSLTARAGFVRRLRITHHSKWVQLQNLISEHCSKRWRERETGIVNTPPSENTVEPVLSSHPQGMTGWSLNKSWLQNRSIIKTMFYLTWPLIVLKFTRKLLTLVWEIKMDWIFLIQEKKPQLNINPTQSKQTI